MATTSCAGSCRPTRSSSEPPRPLPPQPRHVDSYGIGLCWTRALSGTPPHRRGAAGWYSRPLCRTSLCPSQGPLVERGAEGGGDSDLHAWRNRLGGGEPDKRPFLVVPQSCVKEGSFLLNGQLSLHLYFCISQTLSFIPPWVARTEQEAVCCWGVQGTPHSATQLTLGGGVGISIFVRTSDVQTFQGADGTSGLSRPSNPADRATDPRGFPALSQLGRGGSGYPLSSPPLPVVLLPYVSPKRPQPTADLTQIQGRAPRISALRCGAD